MMNLVFRYLGPILLFPMFSSAFLCSHLFVSEISTKSEWANILRPSDLRYFDYDLYWQTRQSTSTSFSQVDLKRVEVKLALIDSALKRQEQWINRIPELSLIRSHQLVRLLKDYQFEDLHDDSLRRQFLTKLYLLTSGSVDGFKKAWRAYQQKDLELWVESYYARRTLFEGLGSVLREIIPPRSSLMSKARLKINYLLKTGWFALPFNLPLMEYHFVELNEQNLWKGMNSSNETLDRAMKQDLGIQLYNQMSLIYGRFTLVLFVATLLQIIPDLEKEIDEWRTSVASQEPGHLDGEERFNELNRSLSELDSQLNQLLANQRSKPLIN